MLLQLYEEHNSVIQKKIMEEVIFMPVGSQHYTLCSPSFCCYACEGFALLLKFVMRIVWGATRRLFLLDTTTFGTVSFSAIQLSMLFQEGSIAELKLRCMLRFLHPALVLQRYFWPCHGFSLAIIDRQFLLYVMPFVLHALAWVCLPRFVLSSL
jgi:hypothetical protein